MHVSRGLHDATRMETSHTCFGATVLGHDLGPIVPEGFFPCSGLPNLLRNRALELVGTLEKAGEGYPQHGLDALDDDVFVVTHALGAQHPHGQVAERKVQGGQGKVNAHGQPAVLLGEPLQSLGEGRRGLWAAQVRCGVGCVGRFVALRTAGSDLRAECCALVAEDGEGMALEGRSWRQRGEGALEELGSGMGGGAGEAPARQELLGPEEPQLGRVHGREIGVCGRWSAARRARGAEVTTKLRFSSRGASRAERCRVCRLARAPDVCS